MNLLYNLLQLLLLPLFAVGVPVYLAARPGRREIVRRRLGFGQTLPALGGRTVIWLHALSVGEITSALPLIDGLRAANGDRVAIALSASTVTGRDLAEKLAGANVDALFYFPYDIVPVVNRVLNRIRPDLFILVETDFWPNVLEALESRQIPALLVNGRVSSQSRTRYRRLAFFFRPLFNRFAMLCMQTDDDSRFMRDLGVQPERIKVLGNLKFAPLTSRPERRRNWQTDPDHTLILGGSTHPGEESLIFAAFKSLRSRYPGLHLALAPRAVTRAAEVVALLETRGAAVGRLSLAEKTACEVTVIDTIGDLPALYAEADIAFIGGSLVPEGGHNPLEAARCGCPVVFGPHMEDFAEIAADLAACQGAFRVDGPEQLEATLDGLLASAELRGTIGRNAKRYAESKAGVIAAHLEVIEQFM